MYLQLCEKTTFLKRFWYYAQKQYFSSLICSTYAPVERIEGIFCLRRKLVNLCHPGGDACKGKSTKAKPIANYE